MVILKYLPSLLALVSFANADCKNFTHTASSSGLPDYYTRTADGSQPISRGFVCDVPNADYEFNSSRQMRCNSTQCPIIGYGIVNVVGTTNLSLSEKDAKPLFDLVPKFTSYKPFFPYEWSGDVAQVASCLNAGENKAGWYAFTPTLLCAEGILSNCNNGPVEDGTAIRVCAPATYGGGKKPSPDGSITFVQGDRDTANFTSNPAATRSPLVNAAGRILASGSGVQIFGIAFWLVVCLGLGSSMVL
ncbi:hypothetical protein VTL71DRAFT_7656 [Oculimacula yallundae]|uniref:Uncharacterized protein n=1 Tax=Oculimacula yallundae TaxID=86028 RepID=A0ABR4BUU2_9HELO